METRNNENASVILMVDQMEQVDLGSINSGSSLRVSDDTIELLLEKMMKQSDLADNSRNQIPIDVKELFSKKILVVDPLQEQIELNRDIQKANKDELQRAKTLLKRLNSSDIEISKLLRKNLKKLKSIEVKPVAQDAFEDSKQISPSTEF